MTLKQAIKILERFNKWRRGGNGKQPDSKAIGEAINVAIIVMKDYGKIYNMDRVKFEYINER
jgi:hypothetical protein